jgi:transcriptional regulator with XRE-family HTH domain
MAGLAAYRRAAGLTQRELSERAGVACSTIEEIEMSHRMAMRNSTMRKLAAAVGVQNLLQIDEFAAAIKLPKRRRGPPKPKARA